MHPALLGSGGVPGIADGESDTAADADDDTDAHADGRDHFDAPLSDTHRNPKPGRDADDDVKEE